MVSVCLVVTSRCNAVGFNPKHWTNEHALELCSTDAQLAHLPAVDVAADSASDGDLGGVAVLGLVQTVAVVVVVVLWF